MRENANRVKFVQHCWDLCMGAISQFATQSRAGPGQTRSFGNVASTIWFARKQTLTRSPRRRGRKTVGGSSMPSALAVRRLTRSSSLVGCSTGRSPGEAPSKILSISRLP